LENSEILQEGGGGQEAVSAETVDAAAWAEEAIPSFVEEVLGLPIEEPGGPGDPGEAQRPEPR